MALPEWPLSPFEHQGDAAPDPSPRPLDSARPQGVGLRTAFLLIGGLLSLVAGGIVAVQLQRGSISTTSAPQNRAPRARNASGGRPGRD